MISCTPPPSPESTNTSAMITSMPVSVIMVGKRDGTAEPVQGVKISFNTKPSIAKENRMASDCDNECKRSTNLGTQESRDIIFHAIKNTGRDLRNADIAKDQDIFLADKDTNRERLSNKQTTCNSSTSSIIRKKSTKFRRQVIIILGYQVNLVLKYTLCLFFHFCLNLEAV